MKTPQDYQIQKNSKLMFRIFLFKERLFLYQKDFNQLIPESKFWKALYIFWLKLKNLQLWL